MMDSCGNFSLSILARKIVLNLSPRFHHILHTEVRNKQRNLSPSARSLGAMSRENCSEYSLVLFMLFGGSCESLWPVSMSPVRSQNAKITFKHLLKNTSFEET